MTDSPLVEQVALALGAELKRSCVHLGKCYAWADAERSYEGNILAEVDGEIDLEDLARAAITILQPLLDERGWRPIESAPKDGTVILLHGTYKDGSGQCSVALWSDGHGWVDDVDFDPLWHQNPTHWMPLPEAPKQTSD